MKPLVCMLLWKRQHNLPDILSALSKQLHKDFTFAIWHNNPDYPADKINDMIVQYPDMDIVVHHADKNHGSQARFAMLGLAPGDPVIYFDDDQIPTPTFIMGLLLSWSRDTGGIYAHHNRRFYGEAYALANVAPPGQETDYCGTGGMIVPRRIVEDRRVQMIPPEFADAEDLWLSYVARMEFGSKLYSVQKTVDHRVDKYDQYWTIAPKKETYFKQLRRMGWRLLKDE